jgi:hypothetical protein
MTAEPASETVKVTHHFEPDVAEALLRDEALRARVSRFVTRPLSHPSGAGMPDRQEPADGP